MPIPPISIPLQVPLVSDGTHHVEPTDTPKVAAIDVPWSLWGYSVTLAVSGQTPLVLGLYGPNPTGQLYGPVNGRAGTPPIGMPPTPLPPPLRLRLGRGRYYVVVYDGTDQSKGPMSPYTLTYSKSFWWATPEPSRCRRITSRPPTTAPSSRRARICST